MEHIVRLHIELLPEGMCLATPDAAQGVIAQGPTMGETVEIARGVAKKLIESQQRVDA